VWSSDKRITRLVPFTYDYTSRSGYRYHRDLRSFPTRRSSDLGPDLADDHPDAVEDRFCRARRCQGALARHRRHLACELGHQAVRSEEHTSELQSRENLVCRLLLEKKRSRHDRATPSTTSPTM